MASAREGQVAVIFASRRSMVDEARYGAPAAASAVASRHHADHRAIRESGRGHRYDRYTVEVATVTRAYDWQRG